MKPQRVLGGHGGPDHILRGTGQVNRGMPEAAVTGGADRVGRRFQIGFTPDGRIVHLYGNDVPADERRQVLSRHAPAPPAAGAGALTGTSTTAQDGTTVTSGQAVTGPPFKAVVRNGYVVHEYPDGRKVRVRKAPSPVRLTDVGGV